MSHITQFGLSTGRPTTNAPAVPLLIFLLPCFSLANHFHSHLADHRLILVLPTTVSFSPAVRSYSRLDRCSRFATTIAIAATDIARQHQHQHR
jgi:hypothetical protein